MNSNATNKFWNDAACTKVVEAMTGCGYFNGQEIQAYALMIAFHYMPGDEISAIRQLVENRELSYHEAVGFKQPYQFRSFRSKLRKLGLMEYTDTSRKWRLRDPIKWVNERLGAAVARKAERLQQLDLALA